MAVDTDASTSASTEADGSCFSLACVSVEGFPVEYKVRLLTLAPPPHERMQLLKIMLPLTPATALAAKSVLPEIAALGGARARRGSNDVDPGKAVHAKTISCPICRVAVSCLVQPARFWGDAV